MKFMNNKGNVAVITALSMPILIGGAGLGVETGYWYYEQLHLQQAADAAAYAAALEHYQGNTSEMLSSATAAAQANSYTSTTDTIAMANPSATYPSDQRTVDVTLTRDIPRAFTAIFNDTPIHVIVKATAKYEPSSTACMLAMSKSASNALSVAGNAGVNVSGCILSSNSLSPSAVNTQGSASVTVPCISSAGGATLNSGTHLTECDSALTGQIPVADPYKDVPLPTPGTCKNWENNAQHTPGTYCASGISMNGRNHTFAAGTYIFNGTDVTVNGGNGAGMTCTGGCTFVFLNGGTISMNGTPTINIQAPTTGTYAGMLFMGDRTGTPETNTFNGDAASKMTGTIYFPNDDVQYNGNFSGFNGCTQVVANTIQWSGNTSVSVDCTAYGMGKIQVGGRPYLVG
ncbi:MAG TPA: pilus assembly protein TadG-related protein [Caulobacteraceae bacterium]